MAIAMLFNNSGCMVHLSGKLKRKLYKFSVKMSKKKPMPYNGIVDFSNINGLKSSLDTLGKAYKPCQMSKSLFHWLCKLCLIVLLNIRSERNLCNVF